MSVAVDWQDNRDHRVSPVRAAPIATVCLFLAACATSQPSQKPVDSPGPGAIVQAPIPRAKPKILKVPLPRAKPDPARRVLALGQPKIVTPSRRLSCVPYARRHSKIQVRGDAWTWWGGAKGQYRRGQRPEVGSVLVFRKKGGSRGHLAVVTAVIGKREILANHANWLNRGRVHLNTPIRDVSPNNDWSEVRVWYTPGKVIGKSRYPTYGFIYPPTKTAAR